jgi:D-3-phosphoglycerate dehydrogenase
MHNVLVTARIFGQISDQAFDVFRRNGLKVVPNPYRGKKLSEIELIELIGGIDALVSGLDPVTVKVIGASDQLKVISTFGTGFDHIDVKAATKKGIVVANTPAVNSDAVADMTFAMMLAVARRIPFAFDQVKEQKWPLIIGVEVCNKTLGLIGLGQIGKRVALRAAGFNMKILANEKFRDESFINEKKIKLVPLNQLLRESDFVSIHVPLTPETKNLIGPDQFEIMQSTAFLINTARGGIVDENALYDALKSGKIAGAAFDVLKEEPLKERRLLELKNFIVTPHISAFTREAIEKTEKLSAQNVVDVLKGHHCPNIINPEARNQ